MIDLVETNANDTYRKGFEDYSIGTKVNAKYPNLESFGSDNPAYKDPLVTMLPTKVIGKR